ncbi:hypothetical protein NPIL_221631 [Nephila pilipes]|uniref:Uncharacterized protein n=1 Tax=Nephila pilipes TaxID=299642 RepID=A0A8X6TYA0_NEPPI|nr:hypothetical protein NPIL_221631 [Nephila pilipes]
MKHVFVYLLILIFMTGVLQAEPSVNEQVKNVKKTIKNALNMYKVGNKIKGIAGGDGLKILRTGMGFLPHAGGGRLTLSAGRGGIGTVDQSVHRKLFNSFFEVFNNQGKTLVN